MSQAERMNSASNAWEADPSDTSDAIADAQLAGFRERAVKLVDWTSIRKPVRSVFGIESAKLIGGDVEFYATHDGEDMLLMQLAWHGFPDPPTWRLATRPSGSNGSGHPGAILKICRSVGGCRRLTANPQFSRAAHESTRKFQTLSRGPRSIAVRTARTVARGGSGSANARCGGSQRAPKLQCMCHFVTLIVPNRRYRCSGRCHGPARRVAAPIDNPSIRKVLRDGEHQYLTARGHCDCGTVLAPRHDTPEAFEEKLAREEARMRRKGWSESKVARAIEDRRKANARPRGGGSDSLELWSAALRDLTQEMKLPYVGLFVRFIRARLPPRCSTPRAGRCRKAWPGRMHLARWNMTRSRSCAEELPLSALSAAYSANRDRSAVRTAWTVARGGSGPSFQGASEAAPGGPARSRKRDKGVRRHRAFGLAEI